MIDLKPMHDAVLNGYSRTAKNIAERALAAGVEPLRLMLGFMMPTMVEARRRLECNEYFVLELLLSAQAMKVALNLIRPLLIATDAQPVGCVVIGTLKGNGGLFRRMHAAEGGTLDRQDCAFTKPKTSYENRQ
jgi:methanogenic corrinoid protein MtbC1